MLGQYLILSLKNYLGIWYIGHTSKICWQDSTTLGQILQYGEGTYLPLSYKVYIEAVEFDLSLNK